MRDRAAIVADWRTWSVYQSPHRPWQVEHGEARLVQDALECSAALVRVEAFCVELDAAGRTTMAAMIRAAIKGPERAPCPPAAAGGFIRPGHEPGELIDNLMPYVRRDESDR